MSVQKEIDALLKRRQKKSIYLDHAATTPMDKRVFKVMEPYFTEQFANPGGFYDVGNMAKKALTGARGKVAKYLGCEANEIIFTGGGTESDNLAIFGVARAIGKGHIITSAIEHPAVLEPISRLEKEGFSVTRLPVDKYGMVSVHELAAALKDDTILVSIMMANNEIGTIQPIKEIGEAIKRFNKGRGEAGEAGRVLFHTDACQAAGACEIDTGKLGVDLMTLNGSKIYGPKGVGVLYKRSGVRILPQILGGHQEFALRAGTENVPSIIGFAKALEIAQKERVKEGARLCALRDRMIAGIETTVKKVRLNGHPTKRLPNNVNVTFLDIEGESFILFLNELGIYASTGSACSSERLDPSHVITALGVSYEWAHGSIRFTLGRSTTKEDIDYTVKVIPRIVSILREISPLNLNI